MLSSDVSLNHSQETTSASWMPPHHCLVEELMPDIEGYSEASGKEEKKQLELNSSKEFSSGSGPMFSTERTRSVALK